jgi:hypothetical protein
MDQRGRAAASIAQPLEAEVSADGSWWPGAVLGWRHDESGGCQAQVRVLVSGAEQVRWVELAAVRLPEAAGPSVAPPAETVVMSRVELRGLLASGSPGRASARRRRHASDLTAELPVVRCAEEEPGRHRAPAAAGAGGRHRAADDVRSTPEPDLRTRPIRLDDVAAWSWSASAAVGA